MSEHEPATESEAHELSWSVNLEHPRHAEDRSLVVEEALDAVADTAAGVHVNLVTHSDHGHPESYLYSVLDDEFGDETSWEYVDQCGCGGYVTRVYVQA